MRRRILLVEDDPDNALVVRLVFEQAGHEVLWARTIAEARAAAERAAPQLAVLDLLLPDGDALDFCAELRRRDPAVPVIVVTAWQEARLRDEAMRRCADAFMTKPFDVEDLERTAVELMAA